MSIFNTLKERIINGKSKISIRHIACSFNSSIIALAEFEHKVHIFDILTMKKLLDLDTVLDFGGRRLCISEKGDRLVAGAYNRYGIVMYDLQTKNVLWERKDLKKVQRIKFNLKNDKIYAFFSDKAGCVLDSKTGKTLKKLKGIYNIYESQYSNCHILQKSTLIIESKGKIIPISNRSFAVLDLEIMPSSFAVTESGKELSVYSLLDGSLLWRYNPHSGNHILKLGYNSNKKLLLGIEWPFVKGGDKKLITFNLLNGNILNSNKLKGCPVETEFALKSSRLITSEGDVLDTNSSSVVSHINIDLL